MTNSSFSQKVYLLVAQIPAGKVATYKDIAAIAGSPGASRAVGSAMKNNPDPSVIPCHRVVGSTGAMHGYAFGGESIKLQRLISEGVVINGGRVDLSASRWPLTSVES